MLGTLLAGVDGVDVPLNGPRQAKVLAALLVEAGRTVGMQRLVDVMWDGDQPATAVRQVQDAVSGLRRNLAGCGAANVIGTVRGGYRIRLETAQLDLLAFENERRLAQQGAGTAEVVAGLRRALACWRGPALADLSSRALESEGARLNALRAAVHKECLGLELALGRHREVVDEANALLREHPLDELVAEQAILALYRSGRRGEALEVYRRTRLLLAEDLGVDPAPALRELHRRVLTADPSLAEPAGHDSAVRAQVPLHPAVTPRQLPADLSDFTGRQPLVGRLLDLLGGAGQGGGPVVLSALNGAGGVGKTSLAVHVAHRVLPCFPDGQLHADLHGLDAQPADPGEVLARFLRALGVAAHDIPTDREEREALYRSTVYGRRLLILLDNARDAAQVRPLLPGSGSCAALITSRGALPGLDGVHRVAVDVLAEEEARELFTRIVGGEVVAAEPDAVAQVLRICAGLPLAIRIAGSRLACQPGWTARMLADRLADESRRLDELHVEDRAVRAGFAVGYAALAEPVARLFRLLGLVPGPTVSLPAALALAAGSARETEDALWALLAAHLLQPAGPGRYRFHDLIRVYAVELATAAEPSERQGLHRLLHWYLHTADHAAGLLTPSRVPAAEEGYWSADNLPVGASRPDLGGFDEAQSWFDAESRNLVAAVHLACAGSEPWLLGLAHRLVSAFWASVYVRGEYEPRWEGICAAAIGATAALGDLAAQATMRKTLGIVLLSGNKPQEALAQFEQAQAIRSGLGDEAGALACAVDVACAYGRLGRNAPAIATLQTVAARYQQAGESSRAAYVLNNLGIVCHQAGESTAAIRHLEASLRIKTELGDVVGQSKTLTSLAEILYVTGRMEQAAERSEQALVALRRSGSRQDPALVLEIAALAYRAQRRPADVDRCRTELVKVYAALDPRQRATVQAELTRLTPTV
ncbi:transcriptional regulator AfsR [Kitasatospora nipponensis]|uniref:Transcriptional regulator AfsR n=1 Tax=Kitasatospora nipponensis TaxID=258049 RepID=A0ABN1VY44_9ACTN